VAKEWRWTTSLTHKYKVEIDNRAFDGIRHRLDDAPLDVILPELRQQLLWFAESPVTRSRPAPIPLWFGHQMFDCDLIRAGDRLYHFFAYFKYSQDEAKILIESFGLVIHDADDEAS
jgi:hypothetical protein